MAHIVNATLTREDFMVSVKHVSRIYLKARYLYWFCLLIILAAYLYLIDFVALTDAEILLYLALYIACLCIAFVFYRRQINTLTVADDHYVLSEKKILVDKKGVTLTSPHSSFFVDWKGIIKIEQTQKYFYFFIDNTQVFCVPLRYFESPILAKEFYEEAQKYWAIAHKNS